MSKNKLAAVASKTPVTHPALPRVPITINDREYLLEYDFNAIARAEELTGLNLFSTFDFTHLSVTKFRAMLFASLIKAQPEITLEDAGNLVTMQTLPHLTVAMVKAWTGSQPELKEEEGEKAGNADAEDAASE